MSKKIKDKVLPKEILSNLKGFEDVFEDYVESEEFKDAERREWENSKTQEQYELQLFLEQENQRLTSLEVFFTKKVPLKTNFPQTEKLIQQQHERKSLIKANLCEEFKKLDSIFQKNLSQFFNSHFA